MSEHRDELKRLFHDACSGPRTDWPACVASAAARDPKLGSDLDALLRSHEAANSFLESRAFPGSPSPGAEDAREPRLAPGSRLGPYEINAVGLAIMGDWDAALEAIAEARALAPSEAWLTLQQAMILADAGRIPRAQELLSGLDDAVREKRLVYSAYLTGRTMDSVAARQQDSARRDPAAIRALIINPAGAHWDRLMALLAVVPVSTPRSPRCTPSRDSCRWHDGPKSASMPRARSS